MNEFLMHREMFCRVIGSACVLVAAIGCGWGNSRRLKLHLQQLRQLQQLMHLLLGEIQYQCSTLPEAFERCGRQVDSCCGYWLKETGRRLNDMEGIGFREIWEQQLIQLEEQTLLTAENLEDLRRLGNQLSYPDKDTQLGAIRLYCSRLEEQEGKLTSELPGKIRLGAMLGVLAGCFLVVLLI